MRTFIYILLFTKLELMKKTKHIYQTFKTFLLVFAICFLVSTQSTAQSELDYRSQSTINKGTIVQKHTIWEFFDWIKNGIIVTTDMSVFLPEESTENIQEHHIIRTRIVTTDMSIRDGRKED